MGDFDPADFVRLISVVMTANLLTVAFVAAVRTLLQHRHEDDRVPIWAVVTFYVGGLLLAVGVLALGLFVAGWEPPGT